MPRSRHLLALLVALALGGFPTAALGQSAGDDQYEDPFADEAPQEQPTPAPQAETPSTPSTPSAPAPDAPSGTAAQADGGSAAAPAPAPAAGEELPRTGADAGLLATTGALLLVGGVALRLRLRRVRPT